MLFTGETNNATFVYRGSLGHFGRIEYYIYKLKTFTSTFTILISIPGRTA
jgi:hypothetical protein